MKTMTIYGDGEHDDTDALQAYCDGAARLIYPDGQAFEWPGRAGARHLVRRTIYVGDLDPSARSKERIHGIIGKL